MLCSNAINYGGFIMFFFVRELQDQLGQREKLVAEDKRFALRTKRTK